MEAYITFMAGDKTISDRKIKKAMKSSGFKKSSFIIRKSIHYITNNPKSLTLNEDTRITRKVKEAVSKSRAGIIDL